MAFFQWKMWRAGLINLKFFMKTKEASRKKTSQNNFLSVQPFIVKMQFEIWKYLPCKLFLPNCRLQNSVQLVPTCFMFFRGVEFTAIYLRRNNNVSCVYEVISSLKYILKVKLNPNFYPSILSEIIGLHENERCGGNL